MGIATAADFERGNTEVLRLPESGLDVRVKRVSLSDLILKGGIPDPLVGAAVRYSLNDPPAAVSDEERARNHRELVAVVNEVAAAMIVEPVVTVDGQPGTLDVREIPEPDRMELYLISTGRTGRWAALRRFPDSGETVGADAAPGREGVRDEAIEPGGVGDSPVGLGGGVS